MTDLSEAELSRLVEAVQRKLLQQARRNAPALNPPPPKEIIPSYDFTCCGQDMAYKDYFGVRRYHCVHRWHHDAIYVNLATGQIAEELDCAHGDMDYIKPQRQRQLRPIPQEQPQQGERLRRGRGVRQGAGQ